MKEENNYSDKFKERPDIVGRFDPERVLKLVPNPYTISKGSIHTYSTILIQDKDGKSLLDFREHPKQEILLKGKPVSLEQLVTILEKAEI